MVYHKTSWKNFTIQCQGELQILLKQREVQHNTDFMCLRTNKVLRFHWNAFKYVVVSMKECT